MDDGGKKKRFGLSLKSSKKTASNHGRTRPFDEYFKKQKPDKCAVMSDQQHLRLDKERQASEVPVSSTRMKLLQLMPVFPDWKNMQPLPIIPLMNALSDREKIVSAPDKNKMDGDKRQTEANDNDKTSLSKTDYKDLPKLDMRHFWYKMTVPSVTFDSSNEESVETESPIQPGAPAFDISVDKVIKDDKCHSSKIRLVGNRNENLTMKERALRHAHSIKNRINSSQKLSFEENQQRNDYPGSSKKYEKRNSGFSTMGREGDNSENKRINEDLFKEDDDLDEFMCSLGSDFDEHSGDAAFTRDDNKPFRDEIKCTTSGVSVTKQKNVPHRTVSQTSQIPKNSNQNASLDPIVSFVKGDTRKQDEKMPFRIQSDLPSHNIHDKTCGLLVDGYGSCNEQPAGTLKKKRQQFCKTHGESTSPTSGMSRKYDVDVDSMKPRLCQANKISALCKSPKEGTKCSSIDKSKDSVRFQAVLSDEDDVDVYDDHNGYDSKQELGCMKFRSKEPSNRSDVQKYHTKVVGDKNNKGERLCPKAEVFDGHKARTLDSPSYQHVAVSIIDQAGTSDDVCYKKQGILARSATVTEHDGVRASESVMVDYFKGYESPDLFDHRFGEPEKKKKYESERGLSHSGQSKNSEKLRPSVLKNIKRGFEIDEREHGDILGSFRSSHALQNKHKNSNSGSSKAMMPSTGNKNSATRERREEDSVSSVKKDASTDTRSPDLGKNDLYRGMTTTHGRQAASSGNARLISKDVEKKEKHRGTSEELFSKDNEFDDFVHNLADDLEDEVLLLYCDDVMSPAIPVKKNTSIVRTHDREEKHSSRVTKGVKRQLDSSEYLHTNVKRPHRRDSIASDQILVSKKGSTVQSTENVGESRLTECPICLERFHSGLSRQSIDQHIAACLGNGEIVNDDDQFW